ncbi:hypothetical protein ACFFRL_15830 [Agromyces hippuratus]
MPRPRVRRLVIRSPGGSARLVTVVGGPLAFPPSANSAAWRGSSVSRGME